MKTKFSKRILSLFLAVLMISTAIPFVSLSASAADGNKYLFTYFTGNGVNAQKINFALSTDGVNFTPLNANRPILSNDKGLTSGVRDPFILKGTDGNYYILATDGDYSRDNWGDVQHSMIVYKSSDLVNWTQTLIDFDRILQNKGIEGSVVRAWAPEAIYDSSKGKYMVYLSLAINDSSVDEYNNNKYVLYYSYTSDLTDVSKYEEPHVLYNPGYTVIDGNIAYNPTDNLYYLYFKDERNNSTSAPNGKRILYTTSKTLNSGYSDNATRFNSDNKGQEGCNSYFVGNDLYMIVDYFNDGQFYIFKSSGNTNFKSFTNVGNINNCSARHGSIISISDEQYQLLSESFAVDTIEYPWNTDASYTSKATGTWLDYVDSYTDADNVTTKPEINFKKNSGSSGGSATISGGNLILSNMGGLVRYGAVRTILAGKEFSATFSFTLDASSPKDAPVFTVSNAATDHIKLSADGTFSVNGTAAGNKANIVAGTKNYFVVSYNGNTVSLYQNGKCVCDVDAKLAIANVGDQLFAGIGFSDTTPGDGYIRGTYGKMKFSSSSINGPATYSELKELMAKAENLLSNGSTYYDNYTNLYNAYVLCQEACDAYFYGNDTTIDFSYAATAMRAALETDTWTPYKANATNKPKFPKDSSTQDWVYNGVLWGNTASADIWSKTDDNSWNSWVRYPEVTFLYTGADGEKLTSSIGMCVAGQGAATKRSRYVCGGVSNNPAISFDILWRGSSKNDANDWNHSGMVQTNYDMQLSRYTYQESGAASCIIIRYKNGFGNYTKYLGNVMNLTPSFADGEYTKDYKPSMTILLNTSEAFSSTDSGNRSTGEMSTALHVVNIKPLLGKINDSKSLIADVSNYSEGGLSTLLTAVDNATSFDPNTYFVNSNDYTGCASKIKTLTEAFPGSATADSKDYANLRTAIANHRDLTKDLCYKDANWKTYQDALTNAFGAMKHVYDLNDSNPYDNYASSYNEVPIQKIADKLNAAVTSLQSDLEHKYMFSEGTKTFVCNHTSYSGAVDLQNYNTLAMIYGTLDTAVFTSEGLNKVNNAKAVFDAMKTTATAKPQDLIDDCVKTLLNAINSNTNDTNIKKQYKVTFKVSLNGTETTVFNETKYNYGSVAALDASTYVGDATCTNWKIEAGGTTKNAAYASNQYSLLVQSDTVVTAYCTTNSDVVVITDQYGATLYSIPATKGQSITISGNTVTVNEVPYTVPNMPYLEITGFTVNGIATNSATVASGTTTIKPISAYSTATSYEIKLDNSTVKSNVKYDDRITVTTDTADAYALAIKVGTDYSIAAYGTTYEFYANRDMEFFTVTGSKGNYSINGTTVTDALMIHNLDYQLPFVYSAAACTDTSNNKFTTFSAYTTAVPKGVTVVEVGTLYTKDASADLVLGSANVYTSVNKYHIDFSNQYSLSIKNGVGKGVRTRAYVKYVYEYGGKTIEAVSYGNICSL